MNQQATTTMESLQLTLQKATELQNLLSKINGMKADKVEEDTNSLQYLDMLSSILYSLNSVTYSYAQLKQQTVPSQFNKVKQYYQKIKDVLQNKKVEGPTSRVNKQALGRIIKRTISKESSSINSNN